MSDEKQISFRVPKWLHEEARIESVRSGRSLNDVLREKLAEWTKQQQEQRAKQQQTSQR